MASTVKLGIQLLDKDNTAGNVTRYNEAVYRLMMLVQGDLESRTTALPMQEAKAYPPKLYIIDPAATATIEAKHHNDIAIGRLSVARKDAGQMEEGAWTWITPKRGYWINKQRAPWVFDGTNWAQQ